MSDYSWVPFFQELAKKISDYENKQIELIKLLKETGYYDDLKEQDSDGRPVEFSEVDPFTFYSVILKFGKDKMIDILSHLKEKLVLSTPIPTGFHGVPAPNRQKAWFVANKRERQKGDIPLLWNLFNQALENKIDNVTFNRALQVRCVGPAKLTQGLFWIRPDLYLPIDSQTKPYLKQKGINTDFENNEKPYDTYEQILKKVKLEIAEPFYEVSHDAWKANSQVEDVKLKKMCLIGTWKTVEDDYDSVIEAIEERGGWASWWSFIINEDAEKQLKKPFYIYLNSGGGNFYYRMKVDDYRTSRGNDGIKSPWPDLTDGPHKGNKSAGDKKSEIFKTWLKVTNIEKLQSPLTLDDLEIAEPLSSIDNVLNQNRFGYVYINDNESKDNESPRTKVYRKADPMSDLFLTEEQFNEILDLLRYKKNIILQGPPGVGKTFVAKRLAYAMMEDKDNDRVEMIQFHQSYSYEDFMQGYRPNGTGFELKNGIFYDFCKQAQADEERDYFFIIDEINRGNLSKIFGELMMLIESDKRGEEISLTYANSRDQKFHIPKNLYLIGTMNTADRSLAMVDYALRRRFCFIDLRPEFESERFKNYFLKLGSNDRLINKIIKKLTLLNEEISADKKNLGQGFCIGHSYFCAKADSGNYDDNWYRMIVQREIAPLLREYWFDDLSKAESKIQELLD